MDREQIIRELKTKPQKRKEAFEDFCMRDDAADIIYLITDAHMHIGVARLEQVMDEIYNGMARERECTEILHELHVTQSSQP